jgi:hypothetical protein
VSPGSSSILKAWKPGTHGLSTVASGAAGEGLFDDPVVAESLGVDRQALEQPG